MPDPFRVSVLIVNWNGCRLLEPCFRALEQQTVPPFEVIVVDNGSQDDSRAWLEANPKPWLKTVFLDRNTGFSGGNNAGFPRISGNIVALLNNDTVVDPHWIEHALPHFENPEVGMVACKSLRLDAPDTIDKAGHLIYPDGLNRGKGTGLDDGPDFAKPAEALWPDGGAGFYRKSMLDLIGFFDDDFFLYGEDAELGMRARWAGYSCIFEPQSWLLHHHSATMGKSSPAKLYFIERNRIWVLAKTFPLSYILLSPWHSLLRYVMNGVSLLTGKGAAAGFSSGGSTFQMPWQLFRATRDGLLGVPRMLAKRKKFPKNITTSEMKILLKRFRISVRDLTLQD